jgi:ribosomal protein S18 acetylase RimI-like enzyme
LYGSTRVEELEPTGWSDAEKQAFLRQQFEAQDRHYREHYPQASFQVIEVDGRPAGRLYVARGAREIRLMDVALLPQHRGRGVGSRLIRDLIEEGVRSARFVSIHVEVFNPARHLYERLGFRPREDRGVYVLMEWHPPGEAPAGGE